MRSIELFSERDDTAQIVLVIPPDEQEMIKLKWEAKLQFFNVKICTGGEERFESVGNAFEHLKDDIDLIAVHDAVRCCTKKLWIDQAIETASRTGAAILASPLIGTIKQADDHTVTKTLDRSKLYEAQTPQVFNAALLKKAYDNLENIDKSTISDDAQLIEALGEDVSIIKTDNSNIKITNKSDIPIAEAIIKTSKPKPKGPLGPYVEAKW